MWRDAERLYLDAGELHLLMMAAVRQAARMVATDDARVQGLILADLARAMGELGDRLPPRLCVLAPATPEQGRHLAQQLIALDEARS